MGDESPTKDIFDLEDEELDKYLDEDDIGDVEIDGEGNEVTDTSSDKKTDQEPEEGDKPKEGEKPEEGEGQTEPGETTAVDPEKDQPKTGQESGGTITEDPKDAEIARLREENERLAGTMAAFERDPQGFVRANPQLARQLGIDVEAVQAEAIPGVPIPFQDLETRYRAQEDKILEQLKGQDLDQYDRAMQEVSVRRASRQQHYELKMLDQEAEQQKELDDNARKEVGGFVGKYGKSKENPQGLSYEEIEKVVNFAGQQGVRTLENAYKLMRHDDLIREARIQGSRETLTHLRDHKSITSAGKPTQTTTKEKTDKGLVNREREGWTDEEIEGLTNEELEELEMV